MEVGRRRCEKTHSIIITDNRVRGFIQSLYLCRLLLSAAAMRAVRPKVEKRKSWASEVNVNLEINSKFGS